jgi:hypothetical protein
VTSDKTNDPVTYLGDGDGTCQPRYEIKSRRMGEDAGRYKQSRGVRW